MRFLSVFAMAALVSTQALGQAVKLGELNSYKVFPAFLEPCRKGMELAVSNRAAQRKVLFIASEPLTDKIVWENGNRYTFRLRHCMRGLRKQTPFV